MTLNFKTISTRQTILAILTCPLEMEVKKCCLEVKYEEFDAFDKMEAGHNPFST